MTEEMKAALKEYAEGLRSADYIAQKHGIRIDDLHKAYAKFRANGGRYEHK